MIRISMAMFAFCNASLPVFFMQDGVCVAICDAGKFNPHECLDDEGKPLSGCIDDDGHSQLCDAIWIEITPDDYEVTK